MPTPRIRLACLALLIPLHALIAAPSPMFQSGDRWVALGDSITQDGTYTRYVELFHVLREPEKPVSLVNAGISGDTARGALNRFDWDVVPPDGPKPTVATILFGMNDCQRHLYAPEAADDLAIREQRQTAIDAHALNLAKLLGRLREAGIRPILLTPSPYDDTSLADTPNQPGCNTALAACAERARALATEQDVALVDFHSPLTALMHRLQALDPLARPFGGDRVHPGSEGHLAMAYQLLRAQHPAGPFVQIHLRTAPLGLRFARGAQVDALTATPDGGLSFDYTAKSLPFVIPKEALPGRDWTPLFSELNREELRFTGLTAERYRLTIDDRALGDFARADLEHGIDLAPLATPQRMQAEAVHSILQKRWAQMSKLRRLAQVEYWQAPNQAHPLTLDTMEPLLQAWETRLQAQPPSWESGHPGEYRDWKPKEKEIAARAETLLHEARAAARPLLRRVTLTPLSDTTAK